MKCSWNARGRGVWRPVAARGSPRQSQNTGGDEDRSGGEKSDCVSRELDWITKYGEDDAGDGPSERGFVEEITVTEARDWGMIRVRCRAA